MAETCHQVLKDVGVNPERMALKWASAAEGPRFVELVTGYVASIKAMGPLGEGEGEADRQTIMKRLEAAVKTAANTKVRTAMGNVAKALHKSGDYSGENIEQLVKQKILPAFRKERITQGVLLGLEAGPLDSEGLGRMTGASAEEVDGILGALAKKGSVKGDSSGWSLA